MIMTQKIGCLEVSKSIMTQRIFAIDRLKHSFDPKIPPKFEAKTAKTPKHIRDKFHNFKNVKLT